MHATPGSARRKRVEVGGDRPRIVQGDFDLVLWSRTLPWDHLPGALLLSEAGGWVSRLDGSPYLAAPVGTGLVAARTRELWEVAQATGAGQRDRHIQHSR